MPDDGWLALLIFVARIGDVSIGTTRIICVMRGHRPLAVALGFFEVLIWVFAAANVLNDLDRWINILAYAGGFAAGNAVGMWLESCLAIGMNSITFISNGAAHAVAQRLRLADFCVTALSGTGIKGAVAVCHAVVPRKLTPLALRMAREVDPDVVVTVEDVRDTTAVQPLPYQLGAGKTPLPIGEAAGRRIQSAMRGLFGKRGPCGL